MNVEPIMEELQKAIRSFIMHHALLSLMHKNWNEGCTPRDFKATKVIPLFKEKKGNKSVETYRGISLLTYAGKLWTQILANRLGVENLEKVTPKEQCGFQESRSTIKIIFVARLIQGRCRKQRTPLYTFCSFQ